MYLMSLPRREYSVFVYECGRMVEITVTYAQKQALVLLDGA